MGCCGCRVGPADEVAPSGWSRRRGVGADGLGLRSSPSFRQKADEEREGEWREQGRSVPEETLDVPAARFRLYLPTSPLSFQPLYNLMLGSGVEGAVRGAGRPMSAGQGTAGPVQEWRLSAGPR
jgi:hypothetical protein